MQTERKMRYDLDSKIQNMRLEKLIHIIGKGMAEKVRFYSKKYRQKAEILST